MARTLALAFLAYLLPVAEGNGVCRGAAECDNSDDSTSALFQLQQAVPALRGPLQQSVDEPVPKFECSRNPFNGTCWAQKTACELMETISQWTTNNENITKIKDQLRDLCYKGTIGHSKAAGTTAEVGTASRWGPCKDRWNRCSVDVHEYLAEAGNAGVALAGKAGKVVVTTIAKWMGMILGKAGFFPGAMGFALVGSALSVFFPTGQAPTNPCSHSSSAEWGQCVWEQVRPFVKEYVGHEIDDIFKTLYSDKLKGFQDDLHRLQTMAHDASNFSKDGTLVYMPDWARSKMNGALQKLNSDMVEAAPLFAQRRGDDTAETIYLSMFSSLHVTVMTALFSAWEKRTYPLRHVTQARILCYAKIILPRAVKVHDNRMGLISAKRHNSPEQLCRKCPTTDGRGGPGEPITCCAKEKVTYNDSAQDCTWNEVCGMGCKLNACVPAPLPCDESIQQHAYNCHRAWVQQQSDEMWQQWLAPIPGWIETVMNMSKMRLNKNPARSRGWRARREARRERGERFEDLTADELGGPDSDFPCNI